MSKIGEDIRKVITLSKENMTLSKEIQDCPNQGHGINALYKGGGVRKLFKKRRLWVLRMWIKRTIDSNLTVYVKQSHKTCKLDPNK